MDKSKLKEKWVKSPAGVIPKDVRVTKPVYSHPEKTIDHLIRKLPAQDQRKYLKKTKI